MLAIAHRPRHPVLEQAATRRRLRALDRLPVLAKWRFALAGCTPTPLPPDPPLKLALFVDDYMVGQRSAALLVLPDGRLRLGRYLDPVRRSHAR